jgi:5'-nucleotidase / UDP-sugar diphosphatase
VTSGDNFLAGPEFSVALENGLPLYDGLVYRRMKFDAICLGNHDFDFGPDITADFINSVRNTVFLSANLDFSQEPVLNTLTTGKKPLLAKSTVVKKRGVKIGIVGATTENLNFISSPRDGAFLYACGFVPRVSP